MATPTVGGPSRYANALNPSIRLAGATATGTAYPFFIAPFDCKVIAVAAAVKTAPTGATLIVDVNKNGTTLFTTQAARPTIAISGTSSTTTLPAVVDLVAGDILTLDVDQVGSGTAGAELFVSVTVE